MADFNGFKKNGITYDCKDSTARNDISTINGKIPGGASSSNKMATASDVTGLQDNVKANTKLIKDTVGWSGKNFNKGDANYTFIKGTKRTRNFAFGREVIQGKQYTVSFDVSAISGYTGNNAIGVRFIEDAVSSDDWTILKTESGRVSHTFTARSNCTVGENKSCVYMYIPNSEGNDATITISNLMFTDADILDQTYEPYFDSTAFPRSEQAVLGAKNLLKLTGSSTTKHTVSITINNDAGTVSVNGTSDADYADVHDLTTNFTLPEGTYTLNGTPDGVWVSNNGFYLQLYNVTDSAVIAYNYSGDTTFTLNADKTVKVRLFMGASASISNKVFYPMIRLASDPDSTYAPYAMTNKELTELKESSVTLNVEATVNESRGGNHLYKKGNMVQMVLTLEGLSKNAYQTFATIPEGYRPIQTTMAFPTLRTDHKIVISKAGQVQSADNLDNVNIDIFAIWMV